MIKLSMASLGIEEEEAVLRVLREHRYLGMGVEVKMFEEELLTYLQKDTPIHLATCNTGTSALHLAATAIGLKEGDEVIVPSITYVACFQAISLTGATPVACDINPRTGFMDLEDAKKRITVKTKAMMPVFFSGHTEGIQDIHDFCEKEGLFVIEDGAHAIGETFWPKDHVVTCLSFDNIKTLTCGEGGAVFSKNKELIQQIRDLRLLSVENDSEKRFLGHRSWDFDVKRQGFRYHLSNLNAAIGRAQLQKIDHNLKFRQQLANRYKEELSGLSTIQLLDTSFKASYNFPLIVLQNKRHDLQAYLIQKGIETGVHYKANHLLSFFRSTMPLPHSEFFSKSTLSIPFHTQIQKDEVDYIIKTLLEYI